MTQNCIPVAANKVLLAHLKLYATITAQTFVYLERKMIAPDVCSKMRACNLAPCLMGYRCE